MDDEVRWPSRACQHDGRDLGPPTASLLRRLHVLEDEEELQAGLHWATPPSAQVITAGASSLSKWVTSGLTALGGTSVVLAAVTGFWNASPTELRIAYTAAGALLLGILVVAVAMIVRADVTARATATAAEYQARAVIADAFLRGAAAHRGSEYRLTRTSGEWAPIRDIAYDASVGGLVAITEDGDRVPNSEITGFERWGADN